jgi:heparin binding hemagglutinin HbhA
MPENTTVEELKAPLLAAVGAADLALATVNEILATLRDRAEVAGDRMDDRRAALTRLQEELPKRTEELRDRLGDRLTSEELRKAAEEFFTDATEAYNTLVVRGEAALERLMGQPEFREAAGRVEDYVDQAVELTQEALGNVSAQTRAVGERAAKLVGTLPAKKAPAKKAAKAPARLTAKKAPARKAAKKAPARKAPAKKAAKKTVNKAVRKAPVKKAVKKTAAKKTAVRKAPARKKVTQK